jgi:N-acetylmuramoyl-L-alanine amidase
MRREDIRKIRESKGITPLYRGKQTREQISESELAEDEDFVKVGVVVEEIPTCPNLSELEEFVKSQKPTRRIEFLAVHCTATQDTATVAAILNYWQNTLKWQNPGYHVLVKRDGSFTVMGDFELICNGVAGHNSTSIHISYIGGINKSGTPIDNMSDDQFKTINHFINLIKVKFPTIKIRGHRDFPKVAKACPCFDTKVKFNL